MYRIVDGDFLLEEIGAYHSYGIITPMGLRIEDITLDLNALQQLVEAVNRLEVSELHIMDVVMDFIG